MFWYQRLMSIKTTILLVVFYTHILYNKITIIKVVYLLHLLKLNPVEAVIAALARSEEFWNEERTNLNLRHLTLQVKNHGAK